MNLVGTHADLGPIIVSIVDENRAEKLKGTIRTKKVKHARLALTHTAVYINRR